MKFEPDLQVARGGAYGASKGEPMDGEDAPVRLFPDGSLGWMQAVLVVRPL